jgi:tRNA pseudouridine55 synthase
VQSAAQRSIPPEIVCRPPSLPASVGDGAALPIDKPVGETSHDVVDAVRRYTGVQKVGHAGTLDPMATGLLIVLVARPATRLQAAFMAFPKTYVGTMRLGERTPSHDRETDVSERVDASHLTSDDLEAAASSFRGTINQVPPMYSAVQVEGERLYEKARRGETVDRPPRQVEVDAFEFGEREGRDVRFRVECSKGTYVRSLARDVGENLGVGAHLVELRRTAIGPYRVEEAWRLGALEKALRSSGRADEPSGDPGREAGG